MGAPNTTPGPYRIHVEREHGIGRTKSVYICAQGEWPASQVARVNVMDGLGEREANAHQMAASPALYDTLEGWVKYLDTQSAGSAEEEERLLSAMRAVLAIARGEQP